MRYDEWLNQIPPDLTSDSLWKMEVYRLALFAADIGWRDVSTLAQDRRTKDLSNQLYRALGSISANIAEGYSRGTSRDRARFYEYALGSAREARSWYYNGRHVMNPEAVQHRIKFLTQITRLLLVMVPDQRGSTLREETAIYHASSSDEMRSIQPREFSLLLEDVPF